MHRNAGGDGGKNARDMERLGQQVGGERDKQADQDLDGWLLAGAPNQKVITFAGDPHHHEATEDAPKAIRKNFTTASPGEKLPVSTAAMAKLKATRPEASFNNDSPSRICAILEGSGELAVIADTATGSVGDRIAARANPAATVIAGISQ